MSERGVDGVSRADDVGVLDLVVVGVEDVGEEVSAHVAGGIWGFGRAEEGEPEGGAVDIVTVFPCVDDGGTVTTF